MQFEFNNLLKTFDARGISKQISNELLTQNSTLLKTSNDKFGNIRKIIKNQLNQPELEKYYSDIKNLSGIFHISRYESTVESKSMGLENLIIYLVGEVHDNKNCNTSTYQKIDVFYQFVLDNSPVFIDFFLEMRERDYNTELSDSNKNKLLDDHILQIRNLFRRKPFDGHIQDGIRFHWVDNRDCPDRYATPDAETMEELLTINSFPQAFKDYIKNNMFDLYTQIIKDESKQLQISFDNYNKKYTFILVSKLIYKYYQTVLDENSIDIVSQPKNPHFTCFHHTAIKKALPIIINMAVIEINKNNKIINILLNQKKNKHISNTIGWHYAYTLLFEIDTKIMDLYFLIQLFKKYKSNDLDPSLNPEYALFSIVHAGMTHTVVYHKVLQELGFKMVENDSSSSNNEFCVSLNTVKLPLFHKIKNDYNLCKIM
jgi:hypothetical protein